MIEVCVRGLFLLEDAPRMFEWVLNTPLILLTVLTLSTIYEEAYSEPSQAFGIDVSARVYIYIYIYKVYVIYICIYRERDRYS